jgi:AcrR family transcriptional regulator
MIDRRVARTRALLRRAHLSLMQEKGYDGVTVEDICEAADVGRSTFYAHYANKEELHRDGLETLRRQLSEHSAAVRGRDGEPAGALAFSRPMFEHAHEHLELYRALAGGRGGVIALESVRQMLAEIIRAGAPAGDGRAGAGREFIVQFLVGAYLSVLTWWLDGGARASPEEMDVLFRRVASEGLKAL